MKTTVIGEIHQSIIRGGVIDLVNNESQKTTNPNDIKKN